MRCSKCGAVLRENDKFCSQCGAPYVPPFVQEDRYVPAERDDSLYDERLFRDSFLDDKEDKSHAFGITIAILLVIMMLAVCAAIGYFLLNKNRTNTAGGGSSRDVVIIDNRSDDSGSSNNGSGDGVITVQTDASKQTETQAQPQTETQKQTETETQPQTEAAGIDTAKLQSILAESGAAKIEAYVMDLDHNRNVGTAGSGDKMYASATISVPILYTAATLLDRGNISLNDSIVYVNSIGGRGEANPEERDGQTFQLDYYLRTMLTYSDNNCINNLIDFLTLPVIADTCHSAGFTSVDLQRKIVAEVTDGTENYVSAADLAGMTAQLYNGQFSLVGRDFMNQFFVTAWEEGYPTLNPTVLKQNGGTYLNQNGHGDTRYSETAVISDGTHTFVMSVIAADENGLNYELIDAAVTNASDYIYQCMTNA